MITNHFQNNRFQQKLTYVMKNINPEKNWHRFLGTCNGYCTIIYWFTASESLNFIDFYWFLIENLNKSIGRSEIALKNYCTISIPCSPKHMSILFWIYVFHDINQLLLKAILLKIIFKNAKKNPRWYFWAAHTVILKEKSVN